MDNTQLSICGWPTFHTLVMIPYICVALSNLKALHLHGAGEERANMWCQTRGPIMALFLSICEFGHIILPLGASGNPLWNKRNVTFSGLLTGCDKSLMSVCLFQGLTWRRFSMKGVSLLFLESPKRMNHYPYFADEKTEAQRDRVACPRPHKCRIGSPTCAVSP